MKHSIAVLLCAALMASCAGDRAKVSGRFAGCAGKEVTLRRITASGDSGGADTALTDSRGRFAFRLNLPGGQPALYRLEHAGIPVTLLVSPGENVRLSCIPGLACYSIQGSPESELVKQVSDMMSAGVARLDSLANSRRMEGGSPAQRTASMQSYVREYRRIKQEQIKFIVEHSGSLAAVYALYQRLPGDEVLFNGDNDIIYYRMVADSVERSYPGSPYLAALRAEIARAESERALADRLREGLETPVSYPEVDMTDVYGRRHALSGLHGKVVLLDFWSAAAPESRLANAELKQLYERYHNRGFEVYQVAVDESRPDWVNAVTEQKLPWITVCDFRGTSCPAVRSYGIREVPANFLIDADGDIVARNVWGDELAARIEKLTR